MVTKVEQASLALQKFTESCTYYWFHVFSWGKFGGLKLRSCKFFKIEKSASLQCLSVLRSHDQRQPIAVHPAQLARSSSHVHNAHVVLALHQVTEN